MNRNTNGIAGQNARPQTPANMADIQRRVLENAVVPPPSYSSVFQHPKIQQATIKDFANKFLQILLYKNSPITTGKVEEIFEDINLATNGEKLYSQSPLGIFSTLSTEEHPLLSELEKFSPPVQSNFKDFLKSTGNYIKNNNFILRSEALSEIVSEGITDVLMTPKVSLEEIQKETNAKIEQRCKKVKERQKEDSGCSIS